MKKNIKTLLIALILIALSTQKVYALEEPEKYTPLYKQYLKLTEEQKKKVNVIPSKYGQSLKEYNKNKTPIFNNRFKSFKGPFNSTPELPSKYNLSENYNIKVENQGEEGNCWTFASLETIETYLQIKENKTFDFSENHLNYIESNLFDETIAYRDINTGGSYGLFEEYSSKQLGPVLEKDFPYYVESTKKHKDYTPDEYESLLNITPQAYVEEYIKFPFVDKENETYTEEELTEYRNTIKKHIINNGAIYAHIVAPSYFDDIYYNHETYAAYFDNTTDPDFVDHYHAVAIIGWDDNYSKKNFVNGKQPKHDGAYIAVNSWGNNFGENGVYYISYDDTFVEQDLNGIKSASTDKSKLTNTTTINIKDKNLYNAIKKDLKKDIFDSNDSAQTITILNNKLLEIYGLNLSSANITDLSGIEYFENLDNINLSNNNISSIKPLKSLHKLTYIDLSNNKLTKIPEELNNAELEALYLKNNSIENFDNLKKIKSIYILNLDETNFTDSDLPLLKDLEISDISLANTKTTDYSILSQNEINHLNISGNKNIKYDTIPNTTYLELAQTTTTESDFQKIKDISQLTVLNISYTNIKDLNIVPEQIKAIYISGNKNIINLDRIKNADSIYYEDAEIEDVSIFKDFNTSRLDLANNNISNYNDLLSDDKYIFLNLSNNNIKNILYSENIYLKIDNNYVKPITYMDEIIESAKNQNYTENLQVDIKRDNSFTEIADYLNNLHTEGYKLEIENATIDYKNRIFKIKNYDKNVIIKISNGKFDGSTITYKIEKVDSTSINYIYVDASNTRRNYIEGADFNPANLKVIANYNNGSEAEIKDYEIIGGKNLQLETDTITIKKDDITTGLYINVIPKEETTTLTFQNKDIYDATLKEIKELEKARLDFAQYYERTTILIDFNDENKTITLYKEDLNEIYRIEIESDTIDSLQDIKQLRHLRSIGINGKKFNNFKELNYLKEISKETYDEERINITLINNESLTIDNEDITSLTLKNSKVNDINNLSKLESITYEGTEDISMDKILDNLDAINVTITKDKEDINKDEEGNIILPNIFKEFVDRNCTIEATIYDQIRDEEYLNPYQKHNIEVTEKDENIVIEASKLNEINYNGTNQSIELSIIDPDNTNYMMLVYKYKIKYNLFQKIELTKDTPIEIEEDTIPDLSNLTINKVYSNKEIIPTTEYVYSKTPITKDTQSIEVSYTEDGITSKIEVPIKVVEHTHDWGEWIVVKEPTETEEGLKERTCKKNPQHKEVTKIDKIEVIEYKIIEGENQTIETDTTDNLIIKVNAEPELFDKLIIDNKEVSPENYQITKGSTVLTIFPKYLNTLSIDTHNIKITFKDNKYVTTTLKVTEKKKEKEKDTTNNKETNIEEKNNITESSNTTNDNINNKNKKSKNPKTGDNILYNVLLLIISILGMIFTLMIKRKAKDSHN